MSQRCKEKRGPNHSNLDLTVLSTEKLVYQHIKRVQEVMVNENVPIKILMCTVELILISFTSFLLNVCVEL